MTKAGVERIRAQLGTVPLFDATLQKVRAEVDAEIELGIAPAWGGTQRLTRTVGRAHALDMILRARKIGAEEAHRIGLVHQVCAPDELLDFLASRLYGGGGAHSMFMKTCFSFSVSPAI